MNINTERWFSYRNNCNNTEHDFSVGFAEATLELLPGFIRDARAVEVVLRERLGHGES